MNVKQSDMIEPCSMRGGLMHLSDPWYKVRHHLIMHRQGGRGVCVCVGGGRKADPTSSRIFKVIAICLPSMKVSYKF